MNTLYLDSTEIQNQSKEGELIRSGVASLSNELRAFAGATVHFDWKNNLDIDTRFRKNPILLRDHLDNSDGLVGRVPTLEKQTKGLYAELEFMQFGNGLNIQQMWDGNWIQGLSTSYTYEKAEWEWSNDYETVDIYIPEGVMTHLAVVTVPRDPDALKNSLAYIEINKYLTPDERRTHLATGTMMNSMSYNDRRSLGLFEDLKTKAKSKRQLDTAEDYSQVLNSINSWGKSLVKA